MKEVVPVQIQQGLSHSDSYILLLEAVEGKVQVPIFIGAYEAQSILLAKEQVATRRPLTHRLMLNMLEQYGMSIKEVTIDRVEEGLFYSTLHVSDGFTMKHFDSRTSDAVTLALLSGCRIMMDEKVLEETGIVHNEAQEKQSIPTLERLEAELRRCEEEEDYERAADIQRKIDQIKDSKH